LSDLKILRTSCNLDVQIKKIPLKNQSDESKPPHPVYKFSLKDLNQTADKQNILFYEGPVAGTGYQSKYLSSSQGEGALNPGPPSEN
jgi:hypothetical protein